MLSSAPPGLESNEAEVDDDGFTISGEIAHLEASDDMRGQRVVSAYRLPCHSGPQIGEHARGSRRYAPAEAPMVASALLVDQNRVRSRRRSAAR